MTVQYGDQIIVHFFNPPQEVQLSSKNPPLNVTLLRWFWIPEERRDELHGELVQVAERAKPIVAKTEDEAMFGRHRNVLVRRVAGQAFMAIHYQLQNAVMHLDGMMLEPNFSGSAFKPHITQHTPVPEGMKIKVGSFTVVEKDDHPRGDLTVGRTYRLEG